MAERTLGFKRSRLPGRTCPSMSDKSSLPSSGSAFEGLIGTFAIRPSIGRYRTRTYRLHGIKNHDLIPHRARRVVHQEAALGGRW